MKKTSVFLFCLTFLFASLALSQPTAPNRKKKTTATKTTAKKGRSSSKTVKRAAAVTPYRQAAPTAERYKEIQQALADKGYLKSEPNGVWDSVSAAALAKFQSDRNLTPTGKITSPSLIALGLGPSTAPVPANPNVHPAADAATGAPPPPASPSLSN